MAALGSTPFPTNYKSAGVNRAEADAFVGKISRLVKPTLNSKVKTAVGGYASLVALDSKTLIAASTDGVGTKLKLAFRLKQHRTVGIDLVAMSVNDLLCVGAKPLFFLDYFATGKLDAETGHQVVEGIAQGCLEAGCALVGGETAEMPDFYQPGEYDLAGFAVGVVTKAAVLPKKTIRPGDALIGIASSGFHSNGYSLLRKWIPEGPSGDGLARELLEPTRIYVKSIAAISKLTKGLAHITGSGFLNVPRMHEGMNYKLRLPETRPDVFRLLDQHPEFSFEEAVQTFNCGVGMVVACEPNRAAPILKALKRSGEHAYYAGEVTGRARGVAQVEVSDESGRTATLRYE